MEKPVQNIQDVFLNNARRDKTVTTIYLMSGVKLTGRIKSFDKYSVILESNNQDQLIFKHAISTVAAGRSFSAAASAPVSASGRDCRLTMDVANSRREKAVLVGCALKSSPKTSTTQSPLSLEESLDELASLTASAGGAVVERLVQEREQYDSAYLIGSGKLRELEEVSQELQAEVVIFDENLSPAQQRNIERKIGRRVIDRTQLILDIFASRARTREGKLQVELAQLNYMLPRLAGRGVELSRLGGGIGTRGPRRDEAGKRPTQDSQAHSQDQGRSGTRSFPSQSASSPSPFDSRSDGFACRLHQRGKIHTVQRADTAPEPSHPISFSRHSIRCCAASSCLPIVK